MIFNRTTLKIFISLGLISSFFLTPVTYAQSIGEAAVSGTTNLGGSSTEGTGTTAEFLQGLGSLQLVEDFRTVYGPVAEAIQNAQRSINNIYNNIFGENADSATTGGAVSQAVQAGAQAASSGAASGAGSIPGASNALDACKNLGNSSKGIVGGILDGVLSNALGGVASGGFGSSGGGSGGTTSNGSTNFISAQSAGTISNWSNATNAFSSNNAYATTAGLSQQEYDGFNFSLPSGAIIRGIEVRIEASATTPGGVMSVELSGNGGTTVTTTNKQTGSLTTTDTTYTLGSATDTWGTSWSQTQVSAGNFRVRLVAQPSNNTVQLDHIQARVHYQVTTGSSGGGSSGGGSFGGFNAGALGGTLGQVGGIAGGEISKALGGGTTGNIAGGLVSNLLSGQGLGGALQSVIGGLASNILGGATGGAAGGAGGVESTVSGLVNKVNGINTQGFGNRVPVTDEYQQALTRDGLIQIGASQLAHQMALLEKECVLDKIADTARNKAVQDIIASITNNMEHNGPNGGPAFPGRAAYYYEEEQKAINESIEVIRQNAPDRLKNQTVSLLREALRPPEEKLKADPDDECDRDRFDQGGFKNAGESKCFAPVANANIFGLLEVAATYVEETGDVALQYISEDFADGRGYPSSFAPGTEQYSYANPLKKKITPGADKQAISASRYTAAFDLAISRDEVTETTRSPLDRIFESILNNLAGGLLGLTKSSGGKPSYTNQLTNGQSVLDDLSQLSGIGSSVITNPVGSLNSAPRETLYASLFHTYSELPQTGNNLIVPPSTSVNPQVVSGDLEAGLNFLEKVAQTSGVEHKYLYTESPSAGSEWTYLGQGGETFAFVNWSTINAVLASGVSRVVLVNTHPQTILCPVAPPSIADVTLSSFARETLLASSNLEFVVVDAQGSWMFTTPNNWAANLVSSNTQTIASNLGSVSAFIAALLSGSPATDPRTHYENVYQEAIFGNYGAQAESFALQLTNALSNELIQQLRDKELEIATTPCTLSIQREGKALEYQSIFTQTGGTMTRTK